MTPETTPPEPAAPSDPAPPVPPHQTPGPFRRWLEHIGMVAPRHGSDPYEHRRGEPRGFVALWTMYLLGASVVTFMWLGPPWRVGAQGYSASARTLLVCVMIGIAVVWPLIRLSQAPARCGGKRSAAIDGAIVWITTQAMVWPQAVVAGWSLGVMLALSFVTLGWCLVVGAMLAWAIGAEGGDWDAGLDAGDGPVSVLRRSLVMGMLSVLTVLGPAVVLVAGPRGLAPAGAEWLWMSSPPGSVWIVTEENLWTGSRAIVSAVQWRGVGLGLVVGTGLWALLAVERRPAAAGA